MRLIWLLLILVAVITSCSVQPPPVCEMPKVVHPANWSSERFYREHFAPGGVREAAVVREFLKGNFPSRIKQFHPVQVEVGRGEAKLILEFSVSGDYLAIGTDDDFVRTPMSGVAAQVIASHLGMVLPTAKMVDWIYNQADVQLVANPKDWFKDQWRMRYGPNYVLFNQEIEAQRAGLSGLIAGHKKDVVASNLLDQAIDHVAIYGWQDRQGRAIQPLSVVHANWYEDYSHGVRLVGPWLTVRKVDGATLKLNMVEALKHPVIGNLLNGNEGPLRDVRAARTCPAEFMRVTGMTAQSCPPQPNKCY